jgi:hypothetical protein
MAVEVDGSGKTYVEVGTLPDERLRLTLVPAAEAGYGVESIRLQIREESGHLRQGPEVPVVTLGTAFAAVVELLLQR